MTPLGNEVSKRLTVDGAAYTTSTSYDAGKSILWRSFGDGSTLGSAGFPSAIGAGQLTSIRGLIADVTYNAAGQPLATSYDNGVTYTAAYDATRGWLNTLLAGKGGTTLLSLNYSRAATGRPSAIPAPGDAAWIFRPSNIICVSSSTQLRLFRCKCDARAKRDLRSMG